MAYADTRSSTAQATGLLGMFARPFVAFGNLLVRMGEASQLAQAVNTLSETTDAELAARGTTREEQVRHIFRGRLYL